MQSEPVGLIAGQGDLPVLFAKAASFLKRPIFVFGVEGITDRRVEEFASESHYVGLGELGKLVELLKAKRIKQVAFAGGVPKKRIYDPSLKLDLSTQSFIHQTSNKGDDHILRALGMYLKVKCGTRVIDPSLFFKDALAPKGVMTRRSPTDVEWKDLKLGAKVARHVGKMDIGQTVVVKDGIVLAVEALEGTDEAIRRGGKLGNGDVVVVKTSKPNQDLRFDLPCVGLETIQSLKASSACALGVEAGKTIMISKEKLIDAADAAGISLVGIG
jgi:DUF1009 family protein